MLDRASRKRRQPARREHRVAFYPDGARYAAGWADDVFAHDWTLWYPDGEVAAQLSFERSGSELEGPLKRWYPNGMLMERGVIDYAESPVGLWETWYDTGQIGCRGQLPEFEDAYEKPCRWWFWHPNGQLAAELERVGDSRVSHAYYDDRGRELQTVDFLYAYMSRFDFAPRNPDEPAHEWDDNDDILCGWVEGISFVNIDDARRVEHLLPNMVSQLNVGT